MKKCYKVMIFYNNHNDETNKIKESTKDLFKQYDNFIVSGASTIGDAVEESKSIKPDYFITIEKHPKMKMSTLFISDESEEINETMIKQFFNDVIVRTTMYTVNANVKYRSMYMVFGENYHYSPEEVVKMIVDLFSYETPPSLDSQEFLVVDKKRSATIMKVIGLDNAIKLCEKYPYGVVMDKSGIILYRTEMKISTKSQPVKESFPRVKTVPTAGFNKVPKKVTIK